jgi:hypothetical protein
MLTAQHPNTGRDPRGPPTELSVQWEKSCNALVWNSIAKNTTAEDYYDLTDVTDVENKKPVKKEVPLDDNV